MSRAENPSAATASATCHGATSAPMTARASTVTSCQRSRTRRGQESRICTRGSSSSVSSRSAGRPLSRAMMASSARTVRPRAVSTQAVAVSGVATPTSNRTCVQESLPPAKAAATSGSSANRAFTCASDWSSRAERPRRSRA